MFLKSLIKYKTNLKFNLNQSFFKFSTETQTIKTRKKRVKPAEERAKELIQYFDAESLEKIPKFCLKRKSKTPETFYNTNKSIASTIAKHLIKDLHKDTPILEVNPGLCLLTKELLETCDNNLLLFEDNIEFQKIVKVINI